MRDEKSGKTRIKFLFGIAVIVAAVYISFKYLIVYVWPFVIGVFIAVILEKKVIYLSDKLYIGLDKLLVWNKRITIKKKKCQGIAATIIVLEGKWQYHFLQFQNCKYYIKNIVPNN